MREADKRFEMRIKANQKHEFERFARENGYRSLAHLFQEGAFALMLKKSIGAGVPKRMK